MPYREDCWSEGPTSALIDAWGDRYLELNRGNLREKDWQEVADAVNSRRGGARRPLRTDSPCKNRIDILRPGSLILGVNPWPFYRRLEVLVGQPPTAAAPKKHQPPSTSPPLALPPPLLPQV